MSVEEKKRWSENDGVLVLLSPKGKRSLNGELIAKQTSEGAKEETVFDMDVFSTSPSTTHPLEEFPVPVEPSTAKDQAQSAEPQQKYEFLRNVGCDELLSEGEKEWLSQLESSSKKKLRPRPPVSPTRKRMVLRRGRLRELTPLDVKGQVRTKSSSPRRSGPFLPKIGGARTSPGRSSRSPERKSKSPPKRKGGDQSTIKTEPKEAAIIERVEHRKRPPWLVSLDESVNSLLRDTTTEKERLKSASQESLASEKTEDVSNWVYNPRARIAEEPVTPMKLEETSIPKKAKNQHKKKQRAYHGSGKRDVDWFVLRVSSVGHAERIFVRAGIPIETWTGHGGLKTMHHLLQEVEKNLCTLQINARGHVRRLMRIAKVRCLLGSNVLIETQQQIETGEIKPTWQFLSIKIQRSEEPRDAAVRAVQNFLEVVAPKVSYRPEVHHETKFTPSYPGLSSHSEYFTFEADVYGEELPTEPFSIRSGKIVHFFEWMSRSEWQRIAAERRARLEAGDLRLDFHNVAAAQASNGALGEQNANIAEKKLQVDEKEKKLSKSARENISTAIRSRFWLEKNSYTHRKKLINERTQQCFYQLFKQLDVDGSGRIDSCALLPMFEVLGIPNVTLLTLRNKLIPQVAPPGTGQLNFEQFSNLMQYSGAVQTRLHNQQGLPSLIELKSGTMEQLMIVAKAYRARRDISRVIFSLIDQDDGGTVDMGEITQALSHMTPENRARMRSLQEACERFAKETDDELNLEDFINLLNQVKISLSV